MVSLDTLPPESLQEIINLLDYIRFKFQKKNQTSTPYKPIALGGLWKDEHIDDKDIDEVRRSILEKAGNKMFFSLTIDQ